MNRRNFFGRALGALAGITGLALAGGAKAGPRPPRADGRPPSGPPWGHPGRVVCSFEEPLRDEAGKPVGMRVLERRLYPHGEAPDFLPLLTTRCYPGLVGTGRIRFAGRTAGGVLYERDARHLPLLVAQRALGLVRHADGKPA